MFRTKISMILGAATGLSMTKDWKNPDSNTISGLHAVNQKIRSHILHEIHCTPYPDLPKSSKKRLNSLPLSVYFWGNGYMQGSDLIFCPNFHPKLLLTFEGSSKANIIKGTLGLYHEAYLSSEGDIYICSKKHIASTTSSSSLSEQYRNDIEKVRVPEEEGVRIIDISLTNDRLFCLGDNGRVFMYKLLSPKEREQIYNERQIQMQNQEKSKGKNKNKKKGKKKEKEEDEICNDVGVGEYVEIEELRDIRSISTGVDHVLFLNREGVVYGMGDNTFGQCAHNLLGRDLSGESPLIESRVRTPQTISLPHKIIKIRSGYNHSLAITEEGKIYGWGLNNMGQLEGAKDTSLSKEKIVSPRLLHKNISDLNIIEAAGGEDFTVVLGEDVHGLEQLYACGNNTRGQLGLNQISAKEEFTIIHDISGHFDHKLNKPIRIKHLSCGRRHCIAMFKYGAFFVWGDNEFGQQGNMRRAFVESPLPMNLFETSFNVENVCCEREGNIVIVEHKKQKNKKKK